MHFNSRAFTKNIHCKNVNAYTLSKGGPNVRAARTKGPTDDIRRMSINKILMDYTEQPDGLINNVDQLVIFGGWHLWTSPPNTDDFFARLK